ncbi:TonB-dependent receptor [Azohydromonas sediminis]|uniref:TonB-dependent receptor n=1 Tax=Azohydromonas sediminis TaxID=2259674 RepID=UPI000E655E6C|nr:TonB-dependent receptor [Azohydromonas sediminis]
MTARLLCIARRRHAFTPLRPAALAAACIAALMPAALHAQTPAATVEIIGTAPLPGQGIDRNWLPYGTQVLRRAEIDGAGSDNLIDLFDRRLPGVQRNDIQGSPYQGDLTYRGFRASGLLGAAQGLSVYLDGVRINEAFGDIVQWDLVPEYALDSVALVPGANPAFGLNTLGGAISLTTLDGRRAAGTRADLTLGSFGRRRVDASHGSAGDDGWHHYVAGTAFAEDGWRDHSAGRIGLVFAKVGHSQGDTDWSLGLLAGRSRLIGNGLVPAYTLDDDGGDIDTEPDLYAARRSAIYTHPDLTRNELLQLAFNARHAIDAATELELLAYVRSSRRRTVNGDAADDGDAEASLNSSHTTQLTGGVAASVSRSVGSHQLQLGASLDAGRTRYAQTEQEGEFTASRGVVGDPDEPPELSAKVRGRSLAFGLWAMDTWRLAPATALTASARYNHARVSNTLTTVDDDTGLLEEKPRERFTYRSLNPALGLAHQPTPSLTLFGNVARNTRVPTVIELGCADPDEPCRLPAGLQSDPYLKQVKSTTVEVGARWRVTDAQRIALSLYRTDNRDDILFTSVSATSQLGYFRNFDKTRHQGLDVQWDGRLGAVRAWAAYSLLEATYQADGTLRIGERNVEVSPGMLMAGLPRHTVKMGLDWQVAPAWTLGADASWRSRRIVQGNEDGLVEDGGDAFDASLPGYALVNLRAAWKPRKDIELGLRIDNVFDRRYETYGALAETVFDASGAYTGVERDAVFVAPGAPRAYYVTLRVRF